MSQIDVEMIKRVYASFNARDIDAVLAVLSDNVAWANGMDGGHVHGRQAVRDYWTRQWAVISPHVEPVAFKETEDGAVAVEVIQSVFDLDGRPAAGRAKPWPEGQDGDAYLPHGRRKDRSLRYPGWPVSWYSLCGDDRSRCDAPLSDPPFGRRGPWLVRSIRA